MSYLSENARYKIVMFDENKNILDRPYYSLPGYDRKGTGKKKLVEKIVKKRYKNKHKYAFIYDNLTGNIIETYIDGILQAPRKKDPKGSYGKDVSMLKIWILYKDKTPPLTRYSHIKTDAEGEEKSYWQLINTHIKGTTRNRIKYAEIYRVKTNEKIGTILRENGKLKGIGIYHRQTVNN